MKILDKTKLNVSLLWHSLFRGMASADTLLKSNVSSNDSMEIIQQQRSGGLMDEMLQQQETKRVIETRDKYYRLLKEADKWDTSSLKMTVDENGGVEFSGIDGLKKKTKSDFIKHVEVYNEENLPIRTIQDNKKIQKHSNFIVDLTLDPNDFDTTITIKRDGITPRFMLEKYAKKVVVRGSGVRAFVDLYLPSEASQFGKVDAILIANLFKIWEEKNLRSDLTDFVSIEWYSDKAWNSDDVCLFKYDDVKFIGTNIFDGNFVLTFDCKVISDGVDLSEKFKTKELDEKYEKEAPKSDAVDIFALTDYQKRRKNDKKDKKDVDVTNLTTTTLKLS